MTDSTSAILDLFRTILGGEYLGQGGRDAVAVIAQLKGAPVILLEYLQGHLSKDWKVEYTLTPQRVANALWYLFNQKGGGEEGVEGKYHFPSTPRTSSARRSGRCSRATPGRARSSMSWLDVLRGSRIGKGWLRRSSRS